MGKIMHLTYSSSLSNLCEINSSFDAAVLRVAYTDRNRNGSSISKEAYERSMQTIFNCPIVCNYSREDDSIGGHDSELVRDEHGMRFVNVTQPVGVVPESARQWWELIEEEDGSVHEYLCTDVLLWKRQEAYRKIKEDGITSESMEITVKDGRFDKSAGVYEIDSFEFTAFCLLGDGVEPCFEQAALEVFSAGEFKKQMTEMMDEIRQTFTYVNDRDCGIEINEDFAKGGNEKLEEKLALIKEFGMDIDQLDFAIDDYSVDELREKLEALRFDGEDGTDAGDGEGGEENGEDGGSEGGEDSGDGSGDPEPEPDPDPDPSDDDTVKNAGTFALNGQIRESICEAVAAHGETVETCWGTEQRYWLNDFDTEKSEVYLEDTTDWHTYGFSYSMNGDNVVIDWESRKRMKYVIVEFDEGETIPAVTGAFSHFEENYQKTIAELREFKEGVEQHAADEARAEVLSRFEDLNGEEAFEALKENAAQYDAEALEEKCFAIRGRVGTAAKFSLENSAPKIMVDRTREEANEPYGGVVRRYIKN